MVVTFAITIRWRNVVVVLAAVTLNVTPILSLKFFPLTLHKFLTIFLVSLYKKLLGPEVCHIQIVFIISKEDYLNKSNTISHPIMYVRIRDGITFGMLIHVTAISLILWYGLLGRPVVLGFRRRYWFVRTAGFSLGWWYCWFVISSPATDRGKAYV